MTTVDTISPVAVADDTTAPAGYGDTPDLACETCGAPLTYSGRGRRPRFCAQHKPRATASATPATKGRPTFDVLETQLAGMLAGLGMILQVVDQFDGNVFILRSEAVAKQWRDAAEKSPAIRRILEKMLETSAISGFIGGVSLLALPILSHHGILPVPEIVVARDVREFTDAQKPAVIRRLHTPAAGA